MSHASDVAATLAALCVLGACAQTPKHSCAPPSSVQPRVILPAPIPSDPALVQAEPTPAPPSASMAAVRDVVAPATVTPAFAVSPEERAATRRQQEAKATRYLDGVRRSVLRAWSSPGQSIQRVTLEFQIAADGCVPYAKVARASSDGAAEGVLEAISQSHPFDPPPAWLTGQTLLAEFALSME